VLSIRIDRLCLVATMDAAANRYFVQRPLCRKVRKSLLSYICGTRRAGLRPNDCDGKQ
jgi:hypothetical protein